VQKLQSLDNTRLSTVFILLFLMKLLTKGKNLACTLTCKRKFHHPILKQGLYNSLNDDYQ